MRALLVCLLWLLSSPAYGQEWPEPRQPVAHTLSNWAVGANLALDTWDNLRADDSFAALGCQSLRLGVTIGAAEVVKRVVRRPRPDRSDHFSFYSEHTALAMQASGWRLSVGVPIALGTGYLRVAAHKHYISDVVVGAIAGLLVGQLC